MPDPDAPENESAAEPSRSRDDEKLDSEKISETPPPNIGEDAGD